MILVVGATGSVGGMIARRLLKEGQDVRAMVRPGSLGQSLVEGGVRTVIGDLKDQDSLAAACAGIETVVTTATSIARRGDDNPQTVELDGNQHLIDAAKTAGVRHFIFVSSVIADPNSPVPYLRGKALAEARLRESGMTFTILAPNGYLEYFVHPIVGVPAMAGREVILAGEGRRKHTFVAGSDVAAFAVAAVDNPLAANQYVPIGGPEAVSYRDAIRIYEQVLDRPIAWRIGQLGELQVNLPDTAKLFLPVLDTYDSTFDTTEKARVFGVKLTTAREWIQRQVALA